MSCATGAAVLNSAGRNGNKSASDLKEKAEQDKGNRPFVLFFVNCADY